MVKIDELINDYELATGRMTGIMTNCNLPDNEFRAADKSLDRAFESLLNANCDCVNSLTAHMEYLLDLIKTMYPDDNLLGRVVNGIHRDMVHLQTMRQAKFKPL